ncbi:hypothetical protein BN59_00365 [Legionella massiliensis]|uniref:Uncharacterized protein n=1 Tax=Legionella massiliensis TaxID=1034943 RepID=A0A078KSR0_9GAMM|nr:hypothetical protein [Legionella massiliensis]CDZ76101.1 hypothetical protein BN59_00365 [Legionella massiliensis]CEE11839.1 hypothetical protein BN1094_00365 [Legionella massiliensis]
MSGFFSGWFPSVRPISTPAQLNTQVANGALQVTNQAVQGFSGPLNPWSILATAFPQLLISGFAIFRTDINGHERFIQILQTLFEGAEIGLSIALIFQHETCASWMTSDICTALALFQTLNGVTVVVTGGVAHFMSGNAPATTAQVVPHTNNLAGGEGHHDDDEESQHHASINL